MVLVLSLSPNAKSNVKYILGSLETVIFLSQLVTGIVVYRCMKFPIQIKIFIVNLICLDIVSSLALATSYLGQFEICIVPESHEIYILFNLIFVTLMPLDRMISLLFTMRYQVKISAKRVVAFCICLWATLLFFVIVYHFFSNHTFFNEQGVVVHAIETDHTVFTILKMTSLAVFLIFVSVNVKILIFVRRLNTRIRIASPLGHVHTVNIVRTPSPWKNLKITISHTILYIFVILVEILSNSVDNVPRRSCIMCVIVAVKVLNPIFLIYRFKECRLQFRLLLSTCRNEAVRNRLRIERNVFYDIFVVNRNCELRNVDVFELLQIPRSPAIPPRTIVVDDEATPPVSRRLRR